MFRFLVPNPWYIDQVRETLSKNHHCPNSYDINTGVNVFFAGDLIFCLNIEVREKRGETRNLVGNQINHLYIHLNSNESSVFSK